MFVWLATDVGMRTAIERVWLRRVLKVDGHRTTCSLTTLRCMHDSGAIPTTLSYVLDLCLDLYEEYYHENYRD